MKSKNWAIAAVAVLLLAPAAYLIASNLAPKDQEFIRDATQDMKNLYGFDGLPESNGKMRPGLAFNPKQLPGLANFDVVEDFVLVSSDVFGASRTVTLSPAVGSGQVRITVYVSDKSVADARDSIYTTIAKRSTMTSGVRGDLPPTNISVGEFNLLFHNPNDINPADPRSLFNMAFARNNVAVFLYFDRDITTVPNLVAIAMFLDQEITKQSETEDLSKSKLKPQIQKFDLAGGKKSISKGTLTPILLNVKPGSGKDESVQAFFLADEFGQVLREPVDGKTKFQYAADKPGNATLTVTVVNERLLISSARIQITITD